MKKRVFLFFFIFLSGVVCANILGVVSGRELGAMNEYFLNRYLYADIQGRELFPFLFYERVPGFLLLLFLSVGIYGTFVVDGYISYLGFSAGFLSVIAIMNYGIKGILFMAGMLLPQWLFYAPVLMLWHNRLFHYKTQGREGFYEEPRGKRKWKLAVSFFLMGILLLLGLFMESYVNPLFLQRIARIMEP